MPKSKNCHWWTRSDLYFRDQKLVFGGYELEKIIHSTGTPLFIYNAARIKENLVRLTNALQERQFTSRIYYAIKANRYSPLLSYIKQTGLCGVDVCSPGEMLLSMEIGFTENEISYTGTSISNQDIEEIKKYPDVWFNCDSLSAIRKLGESCPGRKIGIRINPKIGLSYRQNQMLEYAGTKPSKFGIYKSRFHEALKLADRYNLTVQGIHFHCGCGYMTEQLSTFDDILTECERFCAEIATLKYVNIGGGLGIPLVERDKPLNLSAWSEIIENHFGNTGIEVWIEPGDYIVKDAGLLILEVNTVEEKEGVLFVGVNGGFNIHVEPAFYGLSFEIIPCRISDTSQRQKVTIAGNINEALDLFAEDISLPPVKEGDFLAFLNAGGYGSSMSSNHCLRGNFEEYLLGG